MGWGQCQKCLYWHAKKRKRNKVPVAHFPFCLYRYSWAYSTFFFSLKEICKIYYVRATLNVNSEQLRNFEGGLVYLLSQYSWMQVGICTLLKMRSSCNISWNRRDRKKNAQATSWTRIIRKQHFFYSEKNHSACLIVLHRGY